MKAMLRDEGGLELSEYAVMAGLIIAVIVGTLATLGTTINTEFGKLIANI
jgi:Flp pilus assembly pilin Flp